MADAGFKLGVEGEKEFKAALKEIDKQIKISKSEIKLLTEQFNLNNDSIEPLVAKQKSLAEAMELQGQQVEILEKQLQESTEKYGENDAAVLKTKNDLLEASTALAKTTAAYESNNKALEEQKAAIEDSMIALELTGYTMDEMEKAISEFDASLKASGAEYKAAFSQIEAGSKKIKDFAAQEANLKKQNDILNDSIATQEKKIELLNAKMKIAADRYGEQSKEVSEYREKIANASAELQDMTKKVEANAEALEDSGDSGDKLKDVLEKISEYTGIKIPDGITDMIGGLDDSAVAAGGLSTVLVGVAKKIGEIFKETLDWADELTSKSYELNIDTEQYQALEYAALKAGVGVESIEDALKELDNKLIESYKVQQNYYDEVGELSGDLYEKQQELQEKYFKEGWEENLSKEVEELEDVESKYDEFIKKKEEYLKKYQEEREEINKENAEALEELKEQFYEEAEIWNKLGVNIYDSTGKNLRPTTEIFYELIDALGESSDKSAYAIDVFGESFRKLNPMIEVGSEKLKELEQEAYDVGYVMRDELVGELDSTAGELELFGERASVTLRKIILAFKDIFSLQGVKGLLEKAIYLVTGDDDELFAYKYATGTYNHPGGYALVGEKGPELVELPTGSRVYPNGTYPASMGGSVNNYYVTIDAANVREFNDIVRIAQSERQSTRMGYVGG